MHIYRYLGTTEGCNLDISDLRLGEIKSGPRKTEQYVCLPVNACTTLIID